MNLFNLIPNWSYGIGFLILSISFAIIVFNRGFKFSGKGLAIDAKKINADGIILAFEKVLDTQFEMLRIEFRTRLREQMMYTEDRIKEIKECAIKSHSHLLVHKKISPSEVHNHKQLKLFEKIIDGLLIKMKNETRNRFTEMMDLFNDSKNDNAEYYFIKSEFEKYSDRIVNNMIQTARDYVSKEWIENEFVSRKESFEAMSPFLEKVSEIVKEVLYNGIKIQLKYEKEIKQLKISQKEYIKKITA